jgi:hypothetical protein
MLLAAQAQARDRLGYLLAVVRIKATTIPRPSPISSPVLPSMASIPV